MEAFAIMCNNNQLEFRAERDVPGTENTRNLLT